MMIRKATEKDLGRVMDLFQQIIDQKIYYPYDHTTTREELEASWINTKYYVYVAEVEGQIAGAYIFKPNQPGWGSHVANAAYMVDSDFRGYGIGRKLTEHSIQAAKEAGFRAMQFNIVVSTNKNAVHLWKEYGFEIIGTIPEGFLHHELGYVDACIFYKKL
jgi:L-amino acid N-acyltransferase YncA